VGGSTRAGFKVESCGGVWTDWMSAPNGGGKLGGTLLGFKVESCSCSSSCAGFCAGFRVGADWTSAPDGGGEPVA
jgi:hypothetical protein